MKLVKTLLGLAVAGLVGGILFVYFGIFDVAADEPHSMPFYQLMKTVRERSIAVRARRIEVPPLEDAALIIAGAANYNDMCTGCHLKPGVEGSLQRDGMYPQPPNLTKVKRPNPAETFRIIKHGVKMSGMPAWGPTHDDKQLWSMVAFLQQLPRLTPAQYEILTARSEGEMAGHAHGSAEMKDMDVKGKPR